MTWPEAFAEVATVVVGAAAVVLIFCGWPSRNRKNDDND